MAGSAAEPALHSPAGLVGGLFCSLSCSVRARAAFGIERVLRAALIPVPWRDCAGATADAVRSGLDGPSCPLARPSRRSKAALPCAATGFLLFDFRLTALFLFAYDPSRSRQTARPFHRRHPRRGGRDAPAHHRALAGENRRGRGGVVQEKTPRRPGQGRRRRRPPQARRRGEFRRRLHPGR